MTLILKRGQYPSLIVLQLANSEGEQVLIFSKERRDGAIDRIKVSFPEGSWKSFDRSSMLQVYKENRI